MSGKKFSLDFDFGECHFEDFTKKCFYNLQMIKDKMLIEATCLSDEEKAIDYSKFLLGMGANINGEVDGETPIYTATEEMCDRKQSFVTAKWLVENGVDVNARDYTGWTPLLQAVQYDDFDYVKILVEKGANVEAIIDAERNCDKMSVLSIACGYSLLEIVKYLVEKGASVNARPPDGRTPLICACDKFRNKEQEVNIVQYLIDKGADATITDDDGLTPLAHAKINKKEKLVKILLEHIKK